MKKLIAGILILAVLFFAAVYIFIPSTLNVSSIVYCKATKPGTSRILQSKHKWQQWWIDTNTSNKNDFTYKGDDYSLSNLFDNGVGVNIHHNNEIISSELRAFELVYDSVGIQWKFSIPTGLNPFKKISSYKKAVALKENTKEILYHFKTFVENDDNVYGISVKLSSIEHIFMITTKKVYQHNPSTTEVYNNINFLKQFAATNNLNQEYYPMMNVIKNNDTSYRLMVALPVNKETNFTGDVHSVKMVQGNFITTEIKGGYKTIDNALNDMQQYFEDYEKVSMAIPFQYIVTNRMTEPDTAKWVTKIYAPVQ